MNHAHVCIRRSAALCVFVGVVLGSVRVLPAQQHGALLKRIITDWNDRRASTHTVDYTAVGASLIPQGAFTGDPDLPLDASGDVPPKDLTAELETRWRIDFARTAVRKDVRRSTFHLSELIFVPHERIELFDGTSFKVSEPRETNTSDVYTPSPKQPDFYLRSDDYHRFFIRVFDYPLFLSHGYIVDYSGYDPRAIPSAKVEDLSVHATGVVAGRECIYLRSRPTDNRAGAFNEFVVDVARQSAIVQWSKYAGQRLVARILIDYEETPHGWLAAGWTYEEHIAGRLYASDRVRVTRRAVNEPIDFALFTLEPQAPMIVADANEKDLYRLESDGTRTQIPRGGILAPAKASSWGTWLLWAGVVVLLGLGAYWVCLRTRVCG